MTPAYIALGSNLGKRQFALRAALQHLGRLPSTHLVAVASFRETDPVDAPPGSRRFINTVAQLATALDPEDLLRHLLQIENHLGRVRNIATRNASRIIDLDLLMWGQRILSTDHLTLPHPRMHLRRFVLERLAEIAPDALHPPSGKTIRQLLLDLNALSPTSPLATLERPTP